LVTTLDSLHPERYSRAKDMVTSKMPDLVKGVGFAKPGGNKPLTDDGEMFRRAMDAELALYTAVKQSVSNPELVKAAINPAFTSQFGLFLSQTPGQAQMNKWVAELNQMLSAELGKNISLTSPLASGFVPFDLLAPSRLIYPVYSPLRNKIQRVPGQGTSHRAKLVTGVSGSQTLTGQTGLGGFNIGISEFPSGQGLSTNWPMQLPSAGTQQAVDFNIPYKFFGLTESLSWLAQFEGQGFEDISALANMILLQEFMMGEEYTILSGTGTNLAAPTGVTVTPRAPGSGEVAVTGATTTVYAEVTALNYFGESIASASGSVAVTAGDVYDVSWVGVRGAFAYNVYVTTGSTAGTYYKANSSPVGGVAFTLQGALPTSGTVAPSTDSGTGNSNVYEGIMSIIDGHASTDAGVYPSSPVVFQGGYVNKSVGATPTHDLIFTALETMFDGTGAYRADPAEIVAEGSDLGRLTDEIINSGASNTAYRLFVSQNEVGQITAGGAVSEFINPVTRSIVKLLVHPFLQQGNMFALSYQLPMPWSNVSNVWENVLVQDYLSIAWPVIDLSFRYSLVMNGALCCYAPQYNAVISGLQRSVKPYT